MKKLITALINLFFRLFPIDEKKILFISTNYKVNDNPYAVYRYLKDHKLGYKTVYLVAKDADTSLLEPGDYAYVRSFKGLYHMATYHYRVTCQSYGSIIKKRKGQRYIQLWHGIAALKKMGLDVENPQDLTQLAHTLDWDYYVTSSQADADILKSSSGYTCATKILGAPRTDALFLPRDLDAIKKKLKIPPGKRVLLYAPTFRQEELKKESVTIDFLPAIGEDYVSLVRLHPFVAAKIDPAIFNENVINVCGYPDLNELLAVADLLITDYSSIFYDYSLLEKLTVFYAYDYDSYVGERSGFYVDYKKDLPGPVAYTCRELVEILRNIGRYEAEYREKIKETNQNYNPVNDGQVCRRFAEELQKGGFDR